MTSSRTFRKIKKPRLGHVIEALAGRRSYFGRRQKKRRRWLNGVEEISLFEVEVCCLCVFVDDPMFIPLFVEVLVVFASPCVSPVSSGDLVEVYPMVISIIGGGLVVFILCLHPLPPGDVLQIDYV